MLDELTEILRVLFVTKMKLACCKQLINDGKDTRTKVYSIAEEWYNQQTHPTWDMVVEALWRHGHKHYTSCCTTGNKKEIETTCTTVIEWTYSVKYDTLASTKSCWLSKLLC